MRHRTDQNMEKLDLGLLSFTFSQFSGYLIPTSMKQDFNMEILSNSYNVRARETGEKEIAFILMKVMLKVKAFINNGKYTRYLSSNTFLQVREQFTVAIQNVRENEIISEQYMNSKLQYNYIFRNDTVGPLYS